LGFVSVEGLNCSIHELIICRCLFKSLTYCLKAQASSFLKKILASKLGRKEKKRKEKKRKGSLSVTERKNEFRQLILSNLYSEYPEKNRAQV